MKKKFSFGYAYFKIWVWIASRLFYKRFAISGLSRMPRGNTPTVLISNHQNGMMDPVMCCVTTKRQLHFLTRADLFKNPIANKLLRGFNMIPVYRAIDRVGDLVGKNQESFDTAHSRLLAGNVIALFPEGNHNNRKWLRPFRKGMARVIFGAYEKNNFEGDIQIVPVGIDYSQYTDFREDILLNFGSPISTKKYKEQFRSDPAKALSALTNEAREGLKELMIDIRSKDHYDMIMDLRDLVCAGAPRVDFKQNFDAFKVFTTAADKWIEHYPEKTSEFAKDYKRLNELAENEGISLRALWREEVAPRFIWSLIVFVIAFPFALAGVVLNLLPAWIVSGFVKNQVRDPHFKSSIKLVLGLVVFPLFWIFQGIAVWWIFDSELMAAATLIAAPICGNIAVDSWTIFRNALEVKSVRKLLRSTNSTVAELIRLRDSVISTTAEILKY